MKKFAYAMLASLGLPFLGFAEDGAASIDTSAVTTGLTTWINSLKTTVSGWIPLIVGLLGVGVVIMLIWIGYKFFRKGGNKVG